MKIKNPHRHEMKFQILRKARHEVCFLKIIKQKQSIRVMIGELCISK